MIDIIFFAAIAAFIGFRVYNVLGRKDFEPDQAGRKMATVPHAEKIIEATYVELKPSDDADLEARFGKKLAESIREIRKYDPAFAAETFLNGARRAFEIIIKAFASGDKATLQPLLSKEVYDKFASEMDRREKTEEIEETTLVAIVSSTIKDIVMNKKYARIAVNIVSEQINIIRDKQGKIIEGNPSQLDKIEEIWTFGRDVSSTNPSWELLGTSAA